MIPLLAVIACIAVAVTLYIQWRNRQYRQSLPTNGYVVCYEPIAVIHANAARKVVEDTANEYDVELVEIAGRILEQSDEMPDLVKLRDRVYELKRLSYIFDNPFEPTSVTTTEEALFEDGTPTFMPQFAYTQAFTLPMRHYDHYHNRGLRP